MKKERNEFIEQARQPGAVRQFVVVMELLFMVAFIGAWIVDPLYLVALLVTTPLIIWWGANPLVPLVLMAATFPFTSIELTAGALNVPIADAIAFIALIGWLFRVLYLRLVHKKRIHEYTMPGWPAFFAFIAVAGISAWATVDSQLAAKFIMRPLVFFYLAFIFIPVNTIKTRAYLERLIAVITGLGIITALYGLIGFLIAPASSFFSRRVIPVDILGINPLSGNHNVLANVLIIAIPMGLYVLLRNSERSDSEVREKLLFLGVLAMVSAAVLTFSRTAWLTLSLQLFLLLFFQYRHHMKKVLRYTAIAFFLTLPLIGYMTFFSSQEIVQSSNYNRTLLNEITLGMFQEAPWFGNGPGTYIDLVERNRLYITEFGAPLDAHGFIQKVVGETGLFGLVAYTTVLGWMLRIVYIQMKKMSQYFSDDEEQEYSSDRYLLVTLFTVAAGAAFFQLFQTSYYIGILWLPIGISVAAAQLFSEDKHV